MRYPEFTVAISQARRDGPTNSPCVQHTIKEVPLVIC